ncbi:HEAT repeat domain-containing protein [Arenicella sp. 4NH20-0111]|uniref:HEAT repeat domain-containing protein n=1 Tax=Arenicella sp. 4NH20-0111 TaxID=3127648 RepID=UPI003342531C
MKTSQFYCRLSKSMMLIFPLILSVFSAALAEGASSDDFQLSIKQRVVKTENSISDIGAQWFKYQVRMEPNNGMPCCLITNDQPVCTLEDRTNSWSSTLGELGDSKTLDIYFQVDKGRPVDLFFAGGECEVNVGRSKVVTLAGVSSQQSLMYLDNMTERGSELNGLEHSALAAIALHQGHEAHALLNRYAEGNNEKRKYQAIFWLGEARNAAGYDSLLRYIETDQERKTVAKAVFALSLNSDQRSPIKLEQLAKFGRSDQIQSEAIFWLAQHYPSMAMSAINHIIDNNQSELVRGKAVLSLAQIGSDESWAKLTGLAKNAFNQETQKEAIFWLSQNHRRNPVPTLMEIVGSNSPEAVKKKAVFSISQVRPSVSTTALRDLIDGPFTASVKKEALFWLGQSEDPLALDFLEGILTATH